MRKPHFQEHDPAVHGEILERAMVGHLAYLQDGVPCCLPFNFVVLDQSLWFHGAEQAILGGLLGQAVSVCAQDITAWVPSTWRHPHNACPATTFYRSIRVTGSLEIETDLNQKARVLEQFMQKYQPQGGHRPIHPDTYGKALEQLTVARLSLQNVEAKVKMGQHLSQAKRVRVWRSFHSRQQGQDRRAALEMGRLFPELLNGSDRLSWVDDPRRIPLEQLWSLLQETYWAAGRTLYEVASHLEESILTVAALDGSRLVAYARVASPGRRIAYLFDVVVHPDYRGEGVGSELLNRVLGRPALREVGRIFLDTRDAMDFYRRFGFREVERSDRFGGSSLMVAGSGAGQPQSVDHLLPEAVR